MEPVIRVQPPSPHLSVVDSSSSPEEAGFQPIDPKQHVFRMEYKSESDKPTKGDKEEPSEFGDSYKASAEESNIFHSDAGFIAETDESKCCYRDASGKVYGPFAHDTSHSSASQDDALAEDVSPTCSTLGSSLTKSDKEFETCQSVSHSEDPSTEYSSLATKKDEFEGYPADTDESGAPRITSPYENVPSEHFFTICESRIERDTRQMTSASSSDAHSVEVET
uniref:Uncharacterized protein n=1 Tax=Gopherus evgoodei TaxID=1825980 RepID=A0A8C4W6R2_9SAUR